MGQDGIPRDSNLEVSASPWLKIALNGALILASAGLAIGLAGPGHKLIVAACVGVGLTTILLAIVFKTRSTLRKFRRLVPVHDQALAAMHRGELAQARDVFWRIASTAPLYQLEATARHNLAWVTMRMGELAQAAEIWTNNDQRYGTKLVGFGLSAMTSVDLALCHALLGDLAAARRWLAITDDRVQAPQSRREVPELIILVHAVIDCRAQRFTDAARRLDDDWARCEASLIGATVRFMRVIRGFARAAYGPRDAGPVAAALASMRPAYPGEFDFLGAAWPEMARFLAAHDLATRPAEPAANAR